MKKLILVLLVCSGCWNAQNYRAAVDIWKGRSEELLYNTQGAPDKSVTYPDGRKLLVYNKFKRLISQNNDGTIKTLEHECQTSFLLRNSVIESIGFEGPDCRA